MSEYLISIKIERLEEGGYLATSDTFQGLIAQGRSIAETMEIAQDVARKLIESYIEHGDLNFDGILTPTDATIALEIAVGSRPCDATMLAAADMSRDGRVTSLDALMILQAAAER